MAYVPISKELHGNKNWVRHSSLLFAKADTLAPLLVGDLAAAAHALPIAFVKEQDRFVLVVMMGFRTGENLLVSPNGEWLSEYMPILYRSSPFNLLLAQDHSVLAIDEACLRDATEGEPLFNESGEITEAISNVLERVQHMNASLQMTQNICRALAEHNLLKPWPIKLSNGVNSLEVGGLYCVDEEALNALSDEAFTVLRKENVLPVVYAQLYSMHKLSYLARLAEQRSPLIEEEPVNETFSFAGL